MSAAAPAAAFAAAAAVAAAAFLLVLLLLPCLRLPVCLRLTHRFRTWLRWGTQASRSLHSRRCLRASPARRNRGHGQGQKKAAGAWGDAAAVVECLRVQAGRRRCDVCPAAASTRPALCLPAAPLLFLSIPPCSATSVLSITTSASPGTHVVQRRGAALFGGGAAQHSVRVRGQPLAPLRVGESDLGASGWGGRSVRGRDLGDLRLLDAAAGQEASRRRVAMVETAGERRWRRQSCTASLTSPSRGALALAAAGPVRSAATPATRATSAARRLARSAAAAAAAGGGGVPPVAGCPVWWACAATIGLQAGRLVRWLAARRAATACGWEHEAQADMAAGLGVVNCNRTSQMM